MRKPIFQTTLLVDYLVRKFLALIGVPCSGKRDNLKPWSNTRRVCCRVTIIVWHDLLCVTKGELYCLARLRTQGSQYISLMAGFRKKGTIILNIIQHCHTSLLQYSRAQISNTCVENKKKALEQSLLSATNRHVVLSSAKCHPPRILAVLKNENEGTSTFSPISLIFFGTCGLFVHGPSILDKASAPVKPWQWQGLSTLRSSCANEP